MIPNAMLGTTHSTLTAEQVRIIVREELERYMDKPVMEKTNG